MTKRWLPSRPAAGTRTGGSAARRGVAGFRQCLWQGAAGLATTLPALLGGLVKLRHFLMGVGAGAGVLWLLAQGPRVFPRLAPADARWLMAGIVFLMLLGGIEKFALRTMLLRRGRPRHLDLDALDLD